MRLVEKFEIRVVVPGDGDPNRPNLQILVDGKDLWPGDDRMGYDPEDLLRPSSALLPSDVAKRVAIYRCNCGETGCGSIAPIISADEDFVYWTKFEDFVGVFVRGNDSPGAAGGSATSVPDMKFDRALYEAEVKRAIDDDSWMSNDRKTDSLLEAALAEHIEYFESLGYRPRYVSTWQGNETNISFFHHASGDLSLLHSEPRETNEQRRVFLQNNADFMVMLSSSGTPAERASQMLSYLLDRASGDWK